ncbi:MAG: 50S ribosomal protein L24 [Flavobacteriales bacterium]|nr:50S ribosomal protein L24 [Flavobacteriales bacterium]
MKLNIKKGDNVKVIAGDSKGSTGRVLAIDASKYRATVEGVNMIKLHKKPSAQSPEGGIIEKEGTINISNLMLIDAKDNVTKISRGVNKAGKSVRISKKSGEEI